MILKVSILSTASKTYRSRKALFLLHIGVLAFVLSACSEQASGPTELHAPHIAEAAVASRSNSAEGASEAAADPAAVRLQAALAEYRRIEAAGGWPAVPSGPKLELGVRGGRVATLRQRLAATGDLTIPADDSELFDAGLVEAVRHFQARHGLTADGVVGPKTVDALNVPVAARIAGIRLNLDRVRRAARSWGQRYIEVNVPAASYRYVDGGEAVLAGPAIVGKPSWRTPRVDSVIEKLEFNPYWNVPSSIAQREIWPKSDRDPGYLNRHHMRIINGRIRQDPGPDNPLGRVKFIFDSPYDVYLHDTSSPGLFERTERFLSHGCVRVSAALQLARELLSEDPTWPEQRISEAVESGSTLRVQLIHPIPVHIVYDTVWVDDANIVQFRNDVYGLDRPMQAAESNDNQSFCGTAEY